MGLLRFVGPEYRATSQARTMRSILVRSGSGKAVYSLRGEKALPACEPGRLNPFNTVASLASACHPLFSFWEEMGHRLVGLLTVESDEIRRCGEFLRLKMPPPVSNETIPIVRRTQDNDRYSRSANPIRSLERGVMSFGGHGSSCSAHFQFQSDSVRLNEQWY